MQKKIKLFLFSISVIFSFILGFYFHKNLNKFIPSQGSVIEISGVQPVYVCSNYFKLQKEKENKFYVSKVAEGLLVQNSKNLVKQVNSNIIWEGIVSNIIDKGSYRVKRCDSENTSSCSATLLKDVSILKIKNNDNNQEDYPIFKFPEEMDKFQLFIKKKNEADFSQISFPDLLKYIKLGTRVRVEHLFSASPQFEETYKITIL